MVRDNFIKFHQIEDCMIARSYFDKFRFIYKIEKAKRYKIKRGNLGRSNLRIHFCHIFP